MELASKLFARELVVERIVFVRPLSEDVTLKKLESRVLEGLKRRSCISVIPSPYSSWSPTMRIEELLRCRCPCRVKAAAGGSTESLLDLGAASSCASDELMLNT
jgi:hypothetical protein